MITKRTLGKKYGGLNEVWNLTGNNISVLVQQFYNYNTIMKKMGDMETWVGCGAREPNLQLPCKANNILTFENI